MNWEAALGIVGGIIGTIGAIVSIINVRVSAKKSTVDRQSTILDDLSEAYERLCTENERLRARLTGITEQYKELVGKYDTLEWQYRHVCLWAAEKGYRLPGTPMDNVQAM